ncbi:CheR family methyltransferase [Schlesneria paludicola]|uniref:CheR family methyltransferase n=1 Tax=Schlesneria paludicola TaxID=360056 RepID=UPI00029A1C73|nr:protein-glutamate O-methyltransferase CheR [Schlesneria paludicola]
METADFEYIRDLCHQRAAIVLDLEKSYLIESRLQPLARTEGLGTIADLVAKMRTTGYGTLHGKVIEAMTTNETSFFRDLQPFEALKKVILPELIARRSLSRQLRIWCAACSTGQEPYTIAMLIEENFPQLAAWDVKILATDLSTQVLERARSGRFNQIEVNRGLPSPLVVKYFQRNGMQWELCERVRNKVEFRQLNLIDAWPAINTMDIVFIRNVLIYFDVQTKKDILGKVRNKLRCDGYLFLGGAESTFSLDDSFVRTEVEKASIYRLKGYDDPVLPTRAVKAASVRA